MKIKHVVVLVLAAALSGCQYLPAEEPAPAPAMAKPKVKSSTVKPTPPANSYDPFEEREGDGGEGGGSWG